MLVQRIINRYAAFFRGWCQAFGEHESIPGEENSISWLQAENQIGFILPQQVTRPLNREMLWQNPTPTLDNNRKHFEVLLKRLQGDARVAPMALGYLTTSLHLERVADLATNIAEDVVFLVEGKSIKHHAEDRGESAR